jgi:hypothetical protein
MNFSPNTGLEGQHPMPFELVLFYSDETFTRLAVAAGVSTVIVDWESRGKETRQRSYDTQINLHTADDLRYARRCTSATLICRVNGYGPWTAGEIETAIDLGAEEILLPYIHTLGEVEQTLNRIRGRVGLGIMIETAAAVELAPKLNPYPLARIYVGLNDLMIDRQTRHLFVAVEDGTVERIRRAITAYPFGFAGLTLPDHGYPLPCHLLISEMARLDCHFSFLRRSFYRDIQGRDIAVEVPRILEAIDSARKRAPEQITAEKSALLEAIARLPDGPWRV